MSGDGYEVQWQTNHLAHWVLTSNLLPLLLSTPKKLPAGSVRIVNLTSTGYMTAPKPGINFEDTTLKKAYGPVRYGQSKLANILHARTLNARYGPGSASAKARDGEIWTSSIDPGLVQTGLGDKASEMPKVAWPIVRVVQAMGGRWPADKGAWTSLFLIASPEMKPEQSGSFFRKTAHLVPTNAKGKDMRLAERLDEWTRTEMTMKGVV